LYATDADRAGVADPNDLDDAAMTAARYLCAGGRDLSVPAGWWAAIESYNAVRVYTQDVFRASNDYGLRSR
jgi:membrane-bound lytic murein transglycosylase B